MKSFTIPGNDIIFKGRIFTSLRGLSIKCILYKIWLLQSKLAARRAAMKSSTGHSNLISSNNKDSRIPILLLKEHESQQWTLIIPWFWVLPFWYQLNKVNRVYHMGIKQFQQLAFEQRRLNFPIDYPFTQVGYDEDVLYKKDVLQKLWNRKPPSKRINYMKLGSLHKESLVKGELGSPFCCDWNFLKILQNGLKFLGKEKLDYMNPTRTSTFDVDSGTISVRHVIDIFKLYEKKQREYKPSSAYIPRNSGNNC